MVGCIYKNWVVHNLISHPLSEVLYWLVCPFGKARAAEAAGWFHDLTIPKHEEGEGRG